MSFRRIALGLSAALGIVVIVGLLYVIFTEEDARDPILATATPQPDSRLFAVSIEESQMAISANSTFGEIEGGYDMGGGTVELNEETDGWRVIANLSFDARSLDAGSPLASAAMKELLNVDRYPFGTFVATSDRLITDLEAGELIDLVGQLELHGSVQDYVIPTTVTVAGDKLTLRADLRISPSDFGVDIPGTDAFDADLQVTAYEGAEVILPETPADE